MGPQLYRCDKMWDLPVPSGFYTSYDEREGLMDLGGNVYHVTLKQNDVKGRRRIHTHISEPFPG